MSDPGKPLETRLLTAAVLTLTGGKESIDLVKIAKQIQSAYERGEELPKHYPLLWEILNSVTQIGLCVAYITYHLKNPGSQASQLISFLMLVVGFVGPEISRLVHRINLFKQLNRVEKERPALDMHQLEIKKLKTENEKYLAELEEREARLGDLEKELHQKNYLLDKNQTEIKDLKIKIEELKKAEIEDKIEKSDFASLTTDTPKT